MNFKAFHHDVTYTQKFNPQPGDVVLEFYAEVPDGPADSDPLFYGYVSKIEAEMAANGYRAIDSDDGTDSCDYLCWTHFRKV